MLGIRPNSGGYSGLKCPGSDLAVGSLYFCGGVGMILQHLGGGHVLLVVS